MKHFVSLIQRRLAACFVMSVALVAIAFSVVAAVISTRTDAVQWVDYTGTNFFRINTTLGAPLQVINGSTVNTAVLSTNRQFLGGTGVTNTLIIRNGLIVGIQ
jgi:hypothetical protein